MAFVVSAILYIIALDFALATVSIMPQFFLSMQNSTVRKEDLEKAVLYQVRKMADMLTEEKAISRKTHKDGRKAVLEIMVTDSTKEMARWKSTKMHLYEQYKDGEISQENYIGRIEKGKVRLKELEREKDAV